MGKGGGALVAVFVGAGIAYAVGTGGGGGSSTAAQAVTGPEPWASHGWTQLERRVERGLDCVTASYGQVREYLSRTPCRSVDRELVTLQSSDGHRFAVSVAWVHMAASDGATGLKTLDDRYGTGNVWPSVTTVLRTENVRFTGQYYASQGRGTTTVVSEAAPVSAGTSSATLHSAADVGATLPAP